VKLFESRPRAGEADALSISKSGTSYQKPRTESGIDKKGMITNEGGETKKGKKKRWKNHEEKSRVARHSIGKKESYAQRGRGNKLFTFVTAKAGKGYGEEGRRQVKSFKAQ